MTQDEINKCDIKCSDIKCEGHPVIREGKYGRFLGCSNYPICTMKYNWESIEYKVGSTLYGVEPDYDGYDVFGENY